MTVVCVQLVPVEPGASDDPVLLGRLGAGEWDTISSLGFAADRDRAVTALAAAKLELGHRLGLHPRLVPLLLPEMTSGRPMVRRTNISVSWSHSGGWVALALVSGLPVGVDIELIPERIPVKALERAGVSSIEDFIARQAVGKMLRQGLAAAWPLPANVRPFDTPAGYFGAVAAPGYDWSVELQPSDHRDPPASASAAAIGGWDILGAGTRRMAYARN